MRQRTSLGHVESAIVCTCTSPNTPPHHGQVMQNMLLSRGPIAPSQARGKLLQFLAARRVTAIFGLRSQFLSYSSHSASCANPLTSWL